MTHDELRLLAMRVLKRNRYRKGVLHHIGFGCGLILSELVSSLSPEIPDAIGWSSGRSILIECKTSRSDFLADAKKPHRQAGEGPGETRYFMTPSGLVAPAELPEGWGLLEVDERQQVKLVVTAPRRHLNTEGHRSEKAMLLSTLRRIRTREFLIISAEHLEATLDGK